MKKLILVSALALAAASVSAPAQDNATMDEEAMMEARFAAPPPGWTVPRTEWGDPDLRGVWPVDYLVGTPTTRPASLGTRAFLTDEEYKANFENAEESLEVYKEEDDANMMAMGHWTERGHPLRQSSLIMEPANGQYPALTEEGRRLAAGVKDSWNTEVFDKLTDFGNWDRCLTRGVPASYLPGAYNMGIMIRQSPGIVTITAEMAHETRIVYLDGRAPPAPNVVYDMGFSVGHWEGDTLVVETTNFRPGMSTRPAPNSAQMRMVEHLTLKNPNQIRYEAWVTDPVTMQGGYKLDYPWARRDDYGMYEYACHEGNVQIRGYIMATSPRFEAERQAAWAAREDGDGTQQ